MKKQWMLTILVVATLGCGMTVSAQTKTMPDGTAFDAQYYADAYPDVKAAFGTDEQALYRHYMEHGKAEGRSPVPTADSQTAAEPAAGIPADFDAAYYAQNNPDVVAVYGTDPAALYKHYVEHGKAEGRKANQKAGAAGTAAQEKADAANSIRAQVNALGITYDPGRDANWPEFVIKSPVVDHVDYGKHPGQNYVRGDYTNDPLYLALAQEIVRHRQDAPERFTLEGKIGNVRLLDLDHQYLLNVFSNLIIDYAESFGNYKKGTLIMFDPWVNQVDGEIWIGVVTQFWTGAAIGQSIF